MKNQTAKFESGPARLNVLMNVTQKQIRVSVRTKDSEDDKWAVGCKAYFELSDGASAQKEFDNQVTEAKKEGWELIEKAARSAAFSKIPPAPHRKANGDVPVNGNGKASTKK